MSETTDEERHQASPPTRWKRYSIVAFAIALLAGCVALPSAELKVTAPELKGRVIAAETGTGVEGARVSFEGRSDVYVTTAADGAFTLPRQRDLVLLKVLTPCPVYEYPTPRRYPGAIVIERAGYQTCRCDLRPFIEARHAREARARRHLDSAINIGRVEIRTGHESPDTVLDRHTPAGEAGNKEQS